MENEDIVMQVNNLEKSFRVGNQDISVIKGMSFEIRKGDFTIIIGASGSGKSTLLHMLLGLEVPTSGSVVCLGNSLYDFPSEDARASFRKKYIGMVYQQPNWIKSLNVVENVAFPLSLLGVDKGEAIKQAWHVILKMNMSNWVNYYPTELSGGQQQKIALARALVTDPQVIIADEPTGNLDFESGKALMQLLSDLNSSGKTILMVTHDLEYVKYAKRVIKIFDGKVASITSGKGDIFQASGMHSKRGISLETEKMPFSRDSLPDIDVSTPVVPVSTMYKGHTRTAEEPLEDPVPTPKTSMKPKNTSKSITKIKSRVVPTVSDKVNNKKVESIKTERPIKTKKDVKAKKFTKKAKK